jgi:hypothetical protein
VLRSQGVIYNISPSGDIEIAVSPDASRNIEQRANTLNTRVNTLVGNLSDITRLIARNRYLGWTINLNDPTFVPNDDVIIHDLTAILDQTENLFNVLDFQEQLDEIFNKCIESHDAEVSDDHTSGEASNSKRSKN